MSTKIIRLDFSENFDVLMICKCHVIPCFHFYFLFRNNGKREQERKRTSLAIIVIFFFESVISNILGDSYVQISFSAITKHLGNDI